MDECTDMTIRDAHNKNVHFNSSPTNFTNVIDLNYQKNPFDRQFELARKNNINPLRYAPSIPNLSQTSPLNTPSISLNDGAYISANVQDLIGPSPLIPPTPNVSAINAITEAEPPKSLEDNVHGITRINTQRSNVVSVICTPVPTSKSNESNSENLTVKSAPVVSESAIKNSDKPDPRPTPKSATESLSYLSKSKPLTPITLLVSLPNKEPPFPIPIQVNNCLSSTSLNPEKLTSAKEALSTLIKIVPKLDKSAAINSAQKLLNISSLPSKKKEKTEEELLNKLKATEAALPPKAKPGRKSRSATAEDFKDKKKRSLERNRAAAMRCRLKKKKEVDELKSKVEKYEEQNKDLRRIIESLYNEVRELKSELMRHKDC